MQCVSLLLLSHPPSFPSSVTALLTRPRPHETRAIGGTFAAVHSAQGNLTSAPAAIANEPELDFVPRSPPSHHPPTLWLHTFTRPGRPSAHELRTTASALDVCLQDRLPVGPRRRRSAAMTSPQEESDRLPSDLRPISPPRALLPGLRRRRTPTLPELVGRRGSSRPRSRRTECGRCRGGSSSAKSRT